MTGEVGVLRGSELARLLTDANTSTKKRKKKKEID